MDAFRVDREQGERYLAEVRARADEFAECFGDIAPVAFAATAWRLARPPVLDPGLIRRHRLVLDAVCERNPWDGGLLARVTLASRWPRELTWSRQWARDRGWRDWPQTFGQYLHPTDQDLALSPHLRATLLIEAPVPLADLPPAPEGPGEEVTAAAVRAVTVLVRELNDLVNPIVQQLDADLPRGSAQ